MNDFSKLNDNVINALMGKCKHFAVNFNFKEKSILQKWWKRISRTNSRTLFRKIQRKEKEDMSTEHYSIFDRFIRTTNNRITYSIK